MPKLIISTVGTSLLTNQIDREYEENWTIRLRDTANCTLEEIDKHYEDVKDIITTLKDRAEVKLNGDIDDIREASAELNGIYGLYNEQLNQGEHDIHWLIITDTAQDKVSAEILQLFLSKNGLNISVFPPAKNFSTSSNEVFTNGIDELLNWFEDIIPGYQYSGYEIYFNLVGGFKAIQGFANTIGMFYADKIIYIFEGSNKIITIPRLPIKIDTSVIKPVQFALMAEGAWIKVSELQDIPETLIFTIEDKAILTTWGRLIWNRSKEDFLAGDLLNLPKIKYETSFLKDYGNIKDKKERLKLQETIAKVAHLLVKYNGDIAPLKGDGGVQLETYKNTVIEHFRVTLSLRVSCKFIGSNLSLRYYGTHNHVERSEGIKGK
ncbi:putative CRISPR-associated protein [Nostoc sp. DedVER01b]|uniref:putative CRISPR-associated protein n=1 Tax=Nostoc sp. DedVER01b TaxID=3075404 RepID=UPI002AD2DE22|nr:MULTISPECIES: putative CRISPR-associated protein [unclassified Nostoc]MDZ7988618.1 putative CRISPR-associated protein [Nostoc sp. DedVER02]MDZ8113648.1 putative CRISPR-associated protein [Nostoc sp. DedVER01b]